MPTDRSTTSNTGRPLKPTLATARTAKTPLAPRLAPSLQAAASSSQPSQPSQSSQPSRSARSTPATTPRLQTPSQDERTPSNSSYLGTNVTPRSQKRLSRVGVGSAESTPHTTPCATPNTTRPPSSIDLPLRDAQGYNAPRINPLGGSQTSSRPRSTVGGSHHNPTASTRPQLASVYASSAASDVGGSRGGSSKFFHASDVRPQEPVSAPLQPRKGPVFFYANGQQDVRTPSSELPSPPLSALGKSPIESKFFHADSLAEPRGNSPVLSPSPAASSLLEPWTGGNAAQKGPTVRSSSPTKENINHPYRKGAPQVARPTLRTRPSNISNVSGVSTQSHDSDSVSQLSKRRSSAFGHGKSASLSSIDSVTPLKKPQAPNNPLTITPSLLHNEKRVFSNISLPESLVSENESAVGPLSDIQSQPLSPVRPVGGKTPLEHMNELAANARRERKVLDLEISNSSLLAINRQLEKEVRKQKQELRRYRRMTRAGRFSDVSRTFSGQFSAVGASEMGELSDMSEEEKEEQEAPEAEADVEAEDDDHSYSDGSESSFDEGAMSPSALAARDADHRLRDEKRLQLDLSKHRDLLIDSQKMNESLRRCLNWTEELIKDGQKALAYQVKSSDVKLGGRVLSADEQSDVEEDEDHKTLLSPWSPSQRATDDAGLPLADPERNVRDSGIDVDGAAAQDYGSPLGSPLHEAPPRLAKQSDGSIEAY